jgi:hypothetical protein
LALLDPLDVGAGAAIAVRKIAAVTDFATPSGAQTFSLRMEELCLEVRVLQSVVTITTRKRGIPSCGCWTSAANAAFPVSTIATHSVLAIALTVVRPECEKSVISPNQKPGLISFTSGR